MRAIDRVYYMRGKPVYLKELADVTAVRSALADCQRCAAVSLERLVPENALRQMRAFEAEGWSFVPRHQRAKGAKVYLKSSGRVAVGTNRLTARVAPGVSDTQAQCVLKRHGVTLVERLAPNVFSVVLPTEDDPLEMIERLAASGEIEFAEPQLIEIDPASPTEESLECDCGRDVPLDEPEPGTGRCPWCERLVTNLHNLPVDRALRRIQRLLESEVLRPHPEDIVAIHGWRGGNKVGDAIRKQYAHSPVKNPGRTVIFVSHQNRRPSRKEHNSQSPETARDQYVEPSLPLKGIVAYCAKPQALTRIKKKFFRWGEERVARLVEELVTAQKLRMVKKGPNGKHTTYVACPERDHSCA